LGAIEIEFSRRMIEKGFKAIPIDSFNIYWRNPQIPLIIANLDGEFAAIVSPNQKQFM